MAKPSFVGFLKQSTKITKKWEEVGGFTRKGRIDELCEVDKQAELYISYLRECMYVSLSSSLKKELYKADKIENDKQ